MLRWPTEEKACNETKRMQIEKKHANQRKNINSTTPAQHSRNTANSDHKNSMGPILTV
jgi:hypothetical protein